MSVRGRIGAALAANAFGQSVTVGSQLLLTPLYFRFWGAAVYGEWLILSSIPAYLTMADLGIGSAAGNEMTMRAAAGDHLGAQRTMLAAWWVALASAFAAMLFGAGAAAAAWSWQVPHTPNLLPAQAALVLFGLALTVALGFAGGVLSAGFRCCERNALGIVWGNATRLVEAVCIGVLLVSKQPPEALVFAMLAVRAVALLLQGWQLRALCPWLFVPGVKADLGMVRRLVKPALGFMAFPLGNAIALQGPIFIVGAVFGGSAVAMFSALRTLARVPMQVTSMINSSVWPEMSRAYGANDLSLLRRLHQVALGTTVLVISCLGLLLIASGSWIVHRWLGPGVLVDDSVFATLVVLTALSAAWNASAVVLTAINSHLRLGLVYVAANGLALAVATWATSAFGWEGLLGPMVAAELLLLSWVLRRVLRTTGEQFRVFASQMFSETWLRLRRLMPHASR